MVQITLGLIMTKLHNGRHQTRFDDNKLKNDRDKPRIFYKTFRYDRAQSKFDYNNVLKWQGFEG